MVSPTYIGAHGINATCIGGLSEPTHRHQAGRGDGFGSSKDAAVILLAVPNLPSVTFGITWRLDRARMPLVVPPLSRGCPGQQ